MNKYSVLILFKDDLTIGGKEGFPIPSRSDTIQTHLGISVKNDDSKNNAEQNFFHFKELGKSMFRKAEAKEIDGDYFVWGWWKKPGESHNKMFRMLKDICDKGDTITALLYNRYMRRIYTAEIHDIYYVPFASTVSIPHNWKFRCPEKYKEKPHFCGAYFLMKLITESKASASENKTRENNEIEYEELKYDNETSIQFKNNQIPYKDPQVVLKEYFVDKDTFDDIFLKNLSVISQAEGVIKESEEIVDKEIKPLKLKLTDQTIFLLRKTTKIEKIRELFNADQVKEMNDEIKDLSKDDAIEFIKQMTRKDWEKLFTLDKTIMEIGVIFKNNNMPATSTDIRLVSGLIKDAIFGSADKVSKLEESIISWLLSEDYKKQRIMASQFFSLAWDRLINKKMSEYDEYINKLPQHEEISSSTKQIEGKLYRDHLNHNIRAALMSSSLVAIFRKKDHNKEMELAFYSGLLHDIAHPVASFEGTIQTIQESFKKLNITKSSETNLIIDKDVLKYLVNTIAFIASIPNIKNEKIPVPWDNLNGLLEIVNKELFYEEIMCSMNNEHSFLSAAVVFNAFVHKAFKDMDDSTISYEGVNKLIALKTIDYNDLFQIVQCIALHDRKAACNYKGLLKTRQISMLDMKNFFLPVITIMADEIQEWGRPISANEHSLVVNCNVICDDNENVKVKFNCNFRKEILKEKEYCFLEHFFSKIRIFSRLKNENDIVFILELQIYIEDGLDIFTDNVDSGTIILTQREKDVLWPDGVNWCNSVQRDNDKNLITLVSYTSDPKNIISSSIVFEAKENILINELKEKLSYSKKINKIILSNKSCEIEIDDNIIIKGDIKNYQYTAFQEQSIIRPPDNYEILKNKNIGILFLEDISIDSLKEDKSKHIQEKNLHLFPQPHFLDLDWRFNYKTINSILEFISKNIKKEDGKKGRVCYLGCPSLALYHNGKINEMGVDFTLFDKGHFALRKWLENDYIDKNNFVEYDVQQEIKDEYSHQFDMVIMDPPWYKEFYELFLTRAVEFVKENSIIGFVEYPGYPEKNKKITEFKRIKKKLLGSSCKFSLYCSIEVAYEEPNFEKKWQGHKNFVHSAIGTYRPAYIDFYLIGNPDHASNKNLTLPANFYNSENVQNIEYKDGYVKLKNDYETYFNDIYYWKFKIRKKLNRIKNESDEDFSWVGWSTNNTLIFAKTKSDGIKINNRGELLERLIEYENPEDLNPKEDFLSL
jgi:hypothetical protein